jgi:hypothetical protein
VVEVPDVPDLTTLLKGSVPPLFKYILPFETPVLRKLETPLNPAVPPKPMCAA